MEILEQEKTKNVVRKKVVKIVPYIPKSTGNMGLNEEKMALFEGASYKEQLTCLERNGIKRWLTGLDEFASEVQNIQDKDKKAAVIKEIRKKVIFLEQSFGANVITVDDKDFWSKVKTVHPGNHDFWAEQFVSPGNEPVFLDPENPNDLVTICCIEARGFSCVAPSYEDARLAPTSPKFYLDKDVDTTANLNEIKKMKNKAKALLEDLNDKDTKKMFYVVKNIDTQSYRYTTSTSTEIIYAFLDDYIEGKGAENAKKASINFTSICNLSLEDLKLKAIIADATFNKMIVAKADGKLYHNKTNSMLGGNVAEVLEYMKNPLNSKVCDQLISDIEKLWKEN